MIRLIFDYSTGIHWFDVAADVSVGVIVCTLVAFVVWWLFDGGGDHGFSSTQTQEALDRLAEARPTDAKRRPGSPFRRLKDDHVIGRHKATDVI